MAIITRKGSPKLYTKFMHEGKQIFRSLNTTDMKVALKRETAERVKVAQEFEDAKKEAAQPKPLPTAPTLADFARLPDADDEVGGRFWDWCRKKKRPSTLEFYRQRITAILKFAPLADATLDKIDRELIDAFEGELCEQKLAVQTQKKNMVVLNVILTKAQDWKLIATLPTFTTFPKGEFMGVSVTFEEEAIYMAAVDRDHRDFCSILINSGMEPGTCAGLTWPNVFFGAVGKYTNGYIFDSCMKTGKMRQRELGMTLGLAKILKERWMRMGCPKSGHVFPADRNGKFHHTPLTSFQSTHKRLWTRNEPLAIPRFRLYDFRHTALTRAVEGGASAFDLKQMAGWASIKMADTYIHLDSTARAQAADRFSDYLEAQKSKLKLS
jgi:integrase